MSEVPLGQRSSIASPLNQRKIVTPDDALRDTHRGGNKKDDSVIPLAALKRFADSLAASKDNNGLNKDNGDTFLDINKRRVMKFIEKPYQEATTTTNSTYTTKSLIIATDINAYNEFKKYKPKVLMNQESAEYQKNLGYRSKFGDGDGSFFDKWLNSECGKNKLEFDIKTGLPLSERLGNPKNGFKRQYMVHSMGNNNAEGSTILPYSERRRIRLEKEKAEKQLQVEIPPDTQQETIGSTLFDALKSPKSASRKEISSPKTGEKLTLPPLTAVDEENYYGASGKSQFFDFYRQISRQSQSYTPDKGSPNSLESMKSQREMMSESRSELLLEPTEEAGEYDEIITNLEKKLLDVHLQSPDADGVARPLSARSKFIINSVAANIPPKPSVIIRKSVSSLLDLSSKYIGDKVAVVLASVLDELPHTSELNLANNNLHDAGLQAIMDALCKCPLIQKLNLSQNKIDSKAAASLSGYLCCENCNLEQLVLMESDIDDVEVANFIEALTRRRTVKYLNMSSNLLGSHEIDAEQHGVIGSQAIGAMLESDDCALETLIIAWNKIRLNGAVAIGKAIKLNHSLTHLDLSFNGMGVEGGEALGNALHSNRTLQYLNISSNNIRPRAVYVLMSGVRSCESLTAVDISHNPIGEVGILAVSSTKSILGSRCNIDISGCVVRVADTTCWFDSNKLVEAGVHDYKLDLSIPYDRSICIEILRKLADDDSLKCKKFTLDEGKGYKDNIEFISERKEKVVSEVAVKEISEDDKTNARYLFHKFDKDDSGFLDKAELTLLFKELGFDHSAENIDLMLAKYDVDGTGTVELEEFAGFLQSMQDAANKSKEWLNYDRYVTAKVNDKKYTEPYMPPEVGTVECSFLYEVSDGFFKTVTADSISAIISASRAVADSATLLRCSLQSIYLKYDEAHLLFREMLKDTGDVYKVLIQILPRVIDPSDCQRLITMVTSNMRDKIQVQSSLGQYWQLFIGYYNGFYSFNLANELDRTMLDKLAKHAQMVASDRQKKGYGDVSQNGEYLGFRNAVLDMKPFVITAAWLKQELPTKGTLDVHYVDYTELGYAGSTAAVSNTRLCNILVGLGLLKVTDMGVTLKKLEELSKAGRESSKGFGGHTRHMNFNESFRNELDRISRYSGKRAFHMLPLKQASAKYNEKLLKEELRVLNDIEAKKRANKPKKNVRKYSDDEVEAVAPVVAEDKANSLVDLYGTYIKQLRKFSTDTISAATSPRKAEDGASSTQNSPRSAAGGTLTMPALSPRGGKDIQVSSAASNVTLNRIIAAFLDVLGGKFITCAQLVILLEFLPSDIVLSYPFSTYRVELTVKLYNKLSDLINIDLVLSVLTAKEEAMLIYRLGWLCVINSLKLEGVYFDLNLLDREERMVAKLIIATAFYEKLTQLENIVVDNVAVNAQSAAQGDDDLLGQDVDSLNLFSSKFYIDSEVVEKNKTDDSWQTPLTWIHEATLPKKGYYSVRFRSNWSQCRPNALIRHALMSACLACAYSGDVNTYFQRGRPIIAKGEEILSESGISLSFSGAAPK